MILTKKHSVMNMKIVIIDDDPIARILLKKKLELNGYIDVLMFENGQEGLDYIMSQSPNQSYLIFLDIHMPVINGWQFLDWLKNQGIYNTLVYITSSSINPEEIKLANTFPMVVDFLSKPITKHQISNCENVINGLSSAKDL